MPLLIAKSHQGHRVFRLTRTGCLRRFDTVAVCGTGRAPWYHRMAELGTSGSRTLCLGEGAFGASMSPRVRASQREIPHHQFFKNAGYGLQKLLAGNVRFRGNTSHSSDNHQSQMSACRTSGTGHKRTFSANKNVNPDAGPKSRNPGKP
jgi:hypothetical protein